MLKINNICAKVADSKLDILKGLSLTINDGEVHAIMGPNGTGKSTLSKVIMGNYQYEVTSGSVVFNNTDITNLEVSDRAKSGIFLCMQDPIVINGVSNSEFLRTAYNEMSEEKINLYAFIKEMDSACEKVKLDNSMLHRSLNLGFSGGEKKKNEILQMLFLKPKFIILDELDSGLDVDSLKVICKNINQYKKENPDISILIITHYSRILEYINPDFVHVMEDGKIIKTGDMNLALNIEKKGYSWINEGTGIDKDE